MNWRCRARLLCAMDPWNLAHRMTNHGLEFPQQADRLLLPLPDRVGCRVPGGVERQTVDLAHQHRPLVPGDAMDQARIVWRRALIRIEEVPAYTRERRELARLAQGEPAQLGQQIPQVEGPIPPGARVKIQKDDVARPPAELRGAEVAVEKQGRGGRRRHP